MLLAEFYPLAFITTTPTGVKKLQPLCQSSNATLWVPESLQDIPGAQSYKESLKNHVRHLWHTHRALVFCLATGAVVRLIASLLQHKSTDPAVVVVDETGKFVISLCSGHQGGADKLTRFIALQIGATPVLTGASTGLGLPGVDMLGVPFGWSRGEGDWTAVSVTVARGEQVQVIQEAGSTLWRSMFRDWDTLQSSPKAQIYITPHSPVNSPQSRVHRVHWHPRVLWLGIGCERGTSKELIATAIKEILQTHQLAQGAIAGFATIDIKADEVGLIELSQEWNLPLKTFPAEVLRSVSVPNPSPVVEREVGTPSVAEAASLCAAKNLTLRGEELTERLLVPKQIFRLSGEPGAVTVAVAQGSKEYIGKTGQLFLVGMGPGQLQQMTPAAQAAVVQADIVIGYSLYIDLISSILRPGQIVEALPITQERQRAQRAIELANWGLSVAVVSSGDCGIYGMAGLVLEELSANDWDGQTPSVQVFPGITALQAAAARVGTPLMHDFCAISLSDLLTPWEVIEKRLHAAAQADFVTALYNPRSQTRTQQLVTARDIFLQYRDPNTPVAVVRAAYREDEQITITTLNKLLDASVDMLTTVLIGNQSTRTHANWMITPRGYLGFG